MSEHSLKACGPRCPYEVCIRQLIERNAPANPIFYLWVPSSGIIALGDFDLIIQHRPQRSHVAPALGELASWERVGGLYLSCPFYSSRQRLGWAWAQEADVSEWSGVATRLPVETYPAHALNSLWERVYRTKSVLIKTDIWKNEINNSPKYLNNNINTYPLLTMCQTLF